MSSLRNDELGNRKLQKKKRFGFLGGLFFGSAITLLVAFLFFWYVLLEAPMPWKVTNASDPRFSISEFKYTDYRSRAELKDALKTMFPVGTDKSQVDSILVDIGRGSVERYKYKHESLKDKITYRYSYNNAFRKLPLQMFAYAVPTPSVEWPSHYISIDYDKFDKLERMNVLNGFGLPAFFVRKTDQQQLLEEAMKGLNNEQ